MKPTMAIGLAGHAIFNKALKRWVGGKPGEDLIYDLHVRLGAQLLKELGDEAVLIPTGGFTRPGVPEAVCSEAEGIHDYAQMKGLWAPTEPHVLIEPWARDSFENAFYSLLRFYQDQHAWPERLAFISWAWKCDRFSLFALGLKISKRFEFRGVGTLAEPLERDPNELMEAQILSDVRYLTRIVDLSNEVAVDPCCRAKSFEDKRRERTPRDIAPCDYLSAVADAYASSPAADDPVRRAVEVLRSVEPNGNWKDARWPWLES